jgi:hypothetical protein
MSVTITVGSGKYAGDTNEALQRAVDTVAAAGGGVVEVPAGTYRMRNALHLRSLVRLVGQPGTVLQKIPSSECPIVDYLGYGHYEVSVTDPGLFPVGTGIHVTDDHAGGFYDTVATVIGVKKNLLFIDRMMNHDYHPTAHGRVASISSIIEGCDVMDASIEGLCLDGNPEEKRTLNGCRGGGVFLLRCRNVRMQGLEVRHYNGDAISFQQCTDIIVRGATIHHNIGTGLHPGSGTVRYLMQDNAVHDNGGNGVFYCLRTSHSICSGNRLERNGQPGISVGERDTDHLIRDNTVVGNARCGVEFREALVHGGDRVVLAGNVIGPNEPGGKAEIVIGSNLHDVHMSGNFVRPSGRAALHVAEGCSRLSFAGNTVDGRPQRKSDLAGLTDAVAFEPPSKLPPVGPQVIALDGARHLLIEKLPPWKSGV